MLVLRGYCLSCPHSTLRRESLERDWSLFVGAAQSTAFTNMNRGRSPAEEKLAEELEVGRGTPHFNVSNTAQRQTPHIQNTNWSIVPVRIYIVK